MLVLPVPGTGSAHTMHSHAVQRSAPASTCTRSAEPSIIQAGLHMAPLCCRAMDCSILAAFACASGPPKCTCSLCSRHSCPAVPRPPCHDARMPSKAQRQRPVTGLASLGRSTAPILLLLLRAGDTDPPACGFALSAAVPVNCGGVPSQTRPYTFSCAAGSIGAALFGPAAVCLPLALPLRSPGIAVLSAPRSGA